MDPSAGDGLEGTLGAITEVLLSVASGNFAARVPRSGTGDAGDVLAFLVNATVEEVEHLVADLEREREELKQAQDQLVQAAKLAALGQLASGVAHELNQPLTVVRTLVDLMREHPADTLAQRAPDFELLSTAVLRMGKIVDGVRTFARQSAFTRRPTDAIRPMDDALLLLGEPLRHAGIEVRRVVESPLPPIHADADRLTQVFVNLLANARDALLERSGSDRRVAVSVRAVDGAVVYVVEDTGPGVPDDKASQVFDPFYTTKPPGKGTGLGLSVSRGIVEEHGGELSLEKSARPGARFVVTLPVESPHGR